MKSSLWVPLIALTLFTTTLLAQTASVTGRITDASGAGVPQAKVTAKSAATGTETSTQTNDEGAYNLPSLQPGTYDLSVTKPGFRTTREAGLTLQVQQVARFDIALQLAPSPKR